MQIYQNHFLMVGWGVERDCRKHGLKYFTVFKIIPVVVESVSSFWDYRVRNAGCSSFIIFYALENQSLRTHWGRQEIHMCSRRCQVKALVLNLNWKYQNEFCPLKKPRNNDQFIAICISYPIWQPWNTISY